MKKEWGFSAVEGLLITIIVGLTGFTGWFVYNSQHKTNKTFSDTIKSSVSSAKLVKTQSSQPEMSLPDKAVTVTPTAAEKEEIRIAADTYLHRDSSSKFDQPQEETLLSEDRKFAIQVYCPVGVQSDCSELFLRKVDNKWQGLGAGIQLFDNDRIDLNKKYGWPLDFF